jgi:hypothetical protein
MVTFHELLSKKSYSYPSYERTELLLQRFEKSLKKYFEKIVKGYQFLIKVY